MELSHGWNIRDAVNISSGVFTDETINHIFYNPLSAARSWISTATTATALLFPNRARRDVSQYALAARPYTPPVRILQFQVIRVCIPTAEDTFGARSLLFTIREDA